MLFFKLYDICRHRHNCDWLLRQTLGWWRVSFLASQRIGHWKSSLVLVGWIVLWQNFLPFLFFLPFLIHVYYWINIDSPFGSFNNVFIVWSLMYSNRCWLNVNGFPDFLDTWRFFQAFFSNKNFEKKRFPHWPSLCNVSSMTSEPICFRIVCHETMVPELSNCKRIEISKTNSYVPPCYSKSLCA